MTVSVECLPRLSWGPASSQQFVYVHKMRINLKSMQEYALSTNTLAQNTREAGRSVDC